MEYETTHWTLSSANACPILKDRRSRKVSQYNGPVVKLNKNTIVIWHQPWCQACQSALPFFEELKGLGQESGYEVHPISPNAAIVNEMTHLTAIPTYDVVTMDERANSVYGPGTRLVTFRNHQVDELRRLLKQLAQQRTTRR